MIIRRSRPLILKKRTPAVYLTQIKHKKITGKQCQTTDRQTIKNKKYPFATNKTFEFYQSPIKTSLPQAALADRRGEHRGRTRVEMASAPPHRLCKITFPKVFFASKTTFPKVLFTQKRQKSTFPLAHFAFLHYLCNRNNDWIIYGREGLCRDFTQICHANRARGNHI